MRNKIYIIKTIPSSQQEQYCVIDIGKVLANEYNKNPEIFEIESKFDAYSYFRKIVNSLIEPSKNKLVFANIGILLEKDFSLDVSNFLLTYTKDYALFISQDSLKIIEGKQIVWNVEDPYNVIEFNDGVLEVLTSGGDV